jgi:hypothetical protein
MTFPLPSLPCFSSNNLSSADVLLPLDSSPSLSNESGGEEDRLAGGEGRLMSDTDFPSPPFKKLVPFEYDVVRIELWRIADCRREPSSPRFLNVGVPRAPTSEYRCEGADSGEVPPDFGGCGKAPMLIVLRNLPAGFGVAMPPGSWEVEPWCFFPAGRCGSAEDTERGAVPGVGRREAPDPRRESEGVAGELADCPRDLETGRDGSGVFGGPNEGRDGRGRVVAMAGSGICVLPSRNGSIGIVFMASAVL